MSSGAFVNSTVQVLPTSTWTRSLFSTVSPLGPLTTTFTPPSDCQIGYSSASFVSNLIDDISGYYNTSEYTIAQIAKTCLNSAIGDAASCWPSASTTPYADEFSGWGFYSPGLFCPVGYTTACASVASLSSYSTFPIGDECATTSSSNQAQGCVKATSTKTTLAVCGTASKSSDTSSESDPYYVNFSKLTIFQAPMIQLNWKREDFESYNSIHTSSPIPIPDEKGGGLSSAAVIAIAVVVPIVSLGMIIGLIIWYLRRRKAGAQQDEQQRLNQERESDDSKHFGSELPNEGYEIMELPQPSVELSDPHAERFMQAQRKPSELPPHES
ncbi:uncharacterized protein BKA78DRAFT_293109 [Phyllosticta capitalensis]|uniref:uncharacterized protein n=1 Tax=Phyllosticta capitalensis TaxID=121624 RepID=UPI00312F0853